PAREEPYRRVVPMGRESLTRARRVQAVERRVTLCLPSGHEQLRRPASRRHRLLHEGHAVRMDDGRRRPGSLDHGPHPFRREVGVDHHRHRADAQYPEQCPYVVGPVGEGDEHPLLGADVERAEGVSVPAGEIVHFAVGHRPVVEAQGLAVALTFGDTSAEETFVDVELGGEFDRRHRGGKTSDPQWTVTDSTERSVRALNNPTPRVTRPVTSDTAPNGASQIKAFGSVDAGVGTERKNAAGIRMAAAGTAWRATPVATRPSRASST